MISLKPLDLNINTSAMHSFFVSKPPTSFFPRLSLSIQRSLHPLTYRGMPHPLQASCYSIYPIMYLSTWALGLGVLGTHLVAALPPGSTLDTTELLDQDNVAQAQPSGSLISTTISQLLLVVSGTPAPALSSRSPAKEEKLAAGKRDPAQPTTKKQTTKVTSTKGTSMKVTSTSAKATPIGATSGKATSVLTPAKTSSTKPLTVATSSTSSPSKASPTISSKATSFPLQGTPVKSSSTPASSPVTPYPGQISPAPAIAKEPIASPVKPVLVNSAVTAAPPDTWKFNSPKPGHPKTVLPTPQKPSSFADALDDSLTTEDKADTVKVNKTGLIPPAKRSLFEIAKRSGDEKILSWRQWKIGTPSTSTGEFEKLTCG